MPTLGERIVEHLTANGASLDDGELADALGVDRPDIVATCRQLEAEGLVVRNMAGGTRPVSPAPRLLPPPPPRWLAPEPPRLTGAPRAQAAEAARPWPAPPPTGDTAVFPAHARRVLSARWGTNLQARTAALPGGQPRLFDLVSGNGRIVGDVVWLDGAGDTDEAKWAVVAEAVLIVGHVVAADRRFLVLGQDRDVVTRWLARYRLLLDDVEVWFLDGDRLERLA